MAGAQDHLFPVRGNAGGLFPLKQQTAVSSSTTVTAADWLSNKSFAEKLLPPQAPVPQVFAAAHLLVSSEEDESPSEDDGQQDHAARGPQEWPLNEITDEVKGQGNHGSDAEKSKQEQQPAKRPGQEGGEVKQRSKHRKRRKHRGDYGSSEDSHERRHRKRRRKKEKEKEKARAEAASVKQFQVPVGTERKAAVKTWIGDAPLTADYYFDTTGDRDNLAFGSLYRLDVARYYRQSSHFVDQGGGKRSHFGTQEPEEDAFTRVAGEKRYWGPGQAVKERSTKFKRIKAAPGGGPSTPPGAFIPLVEAPPQQASAEEGPADEGESFEDSLLRRTREFNELTRTRPQELQGWLDFAAFQDEFVKLGKKRQTVQALDKKLAIYEKALDFHPDSDDLLLAYLTASSQKDDAPTLQAKWAKVLKRFSGSTLLWRGYTSYRKGQYSSFTVSDVRGVYAQAIGALVQERKRIRQEGRGDDKVLQAERDLVRLFLDACLFEWQTGHHELAIGLLQAQAEYSVFAPPVQASEANKQRLFQHFWESDAPRIGEKGALGWGTWLAKEEARLQSWNGGGAEEKEAEEEKGGWTGWQELKQIGGRGGESDAESDGRSDDGSEPEKGEEEESDEALLKRLGVNLDVADAVDAADPATWHKWALEEEARGERQWLPVRPKEPLEDSGDSDDEGDADGALQRTVLFDDVQPFLFSLGCDVAEEELLAGFGDFCEAPVPTWTSTNDAQFAEARETVSGSLRNSLERATARETNSNITSASATDVFPGAVETEVRVGNGGEILTSLVGGTAWLDQDPPERRRFVTDLLLQASGAFPASQSFPQALLRLTSSGDVNGKEGRALAKALLKRRRDDLALWRTYTELEATAGRVAAARVVLMTSLNSLSGLSPAAREHAPALFLALAEMDLRGSDGADGPGARSDAGRTQALHTLTCFGEGVDLTPLAGAEVPPSRILRAKNGYRDKLQQIRARSLRQHLTDADVATIGCAALFEGTSGGGWQAAAATYEDALNLGLPGRRVKSPQYEKLVGEYVQTLAESAAKPSRQRQAIMRGLGSFPRNAKLLSALVQAEAHQALANRLRRYFDAVGAKAPSTVGWLFAVASELGRPGARARIRSLFERALAAQETKQSVVLWRAYLAFELDAPAIHSRPSDPLEAARRIFFRALHACPWSKTLWLDGIKKLTGRGALTGKEVSDLCDTMREKEMRIRADIYEILLQEVETEQA